MNAAPKQLGDYLLSVTNSNPAVEFVNSDFTYIDISAVDRDRFMITNPQVISSVNAPSRARQVLLENDVIVSTVRPNLNTVAKVTDVHQGAIASTGFCVLRPNPELLDAGYLFHWISSESTVERLVKMATGATYPAVSDKTIKSQLINLPPLPEQKHIALVLDQANNIQRKRQEAIDLANDFLRAVFFHMFGDPVQNHKFFPLGTIRDLAISTSYGSSQKANENIGKYPMLRMGNITYQGGVDYASLKYVDLDSETAQKYIVKRGDLLFNRTNSKELVGKTAVYLGDDPMAYAGYLVRLRTNEHGNTQYVAGYLNSAHGKRTLMAIAKSIVGMANINAQEMLDIPILLPPKSLQDEYARIVEAMHNQTNQQRQFLEDADLLSKALSHQLLA